MAHDPSADNIEWYRGQVVFLTGGTGNVGGCLLYKLAVQLPTEKVYVLCRGSMRRAMEKWETSMPEHVDEVFDSGKVHCMIGDVTHPQFGLKATDLRTLQREVTVVIHAAASISVMQDLPTSIRQNFIPVPTLIRMVAQFTEIRAFLFISSIAACTFLPPGPVEEKIYQVANDEGTPEAEAASIPETGQSRYSDKFLFPYCEAKYLAERSVSMMTANFPVLIVRASSIGPATQYPFPFYGPEEAIPAHNYLRLLLGNNTEFRSYDDVQKISQDLVVDEIPGDLVAHTCLFHLVLGTSGVVHAGAELYLPLTVQEYSAKCRLYTPKSVIHQLARASLDRNSALMKRTNEMYHRYHRDVKFECRRSEDIKNTTGPIGLSMKGHDFEQFLKIRVQKQSRQMMETMRRAGIDTEGTASGQST